VRLETLRCYVQARGSSAWARVREIGFLKAAARLGVHLGSLLLGLLLAPLGLVLHLAGFRRLTFITARVGHLAAEPDCFLKARALGELPERRWFYLAPADRVTNASLGSYWSALIPTLRNPLACRAVAGMSALGLLRHDTTDYVLAYDRAAQIYRIQKSWGNRPPLLSLTPEDAAWGAESLRALGLPPRAWFVCVHAREGGFAPHDEAVQRYRNSDILSRLPALREIVARGGWCIRMGGANVPPLPEAPGVVDYAHHPLRSERLDVVLCAQARFFLGDSSGLALVSSAFGRPSLLVNMVPFAALGVLPFDLSIPKLYRHRREGRLLRFDEILGTPAASYRFAEQFERAGIELVENSPEEIREAALELLDRPEGLWTACPEDERLQRRYFSLQGPRDYGFGAASRVGAAFLRKYRHLLPPDDAISLEAAGCEESRQ